MKKPYVEIVWNDAHDVGAGEWLDTTNLTEGMVVTSVGILVKKTRTNYIITHSLTEDDQARGTFNIPKGMVISIRTL